MAAPYISLQPTGMSVMAGETGVFSGGATGTEPLWFNWYDVIGGVTGIFGETGPTLYIENAQTANAGEYWFVAANGDGTKESDHVNLEVNYAPYIDNVTPIDVLVPEHATINLGASGATGTQPIWYNWYDLIGGVTGSLGTTGQITISDFLAANVGTYWFDAANAYGTFKGPDINLDIAYPPVITLQPIDTNVNIGETAVFSGGATGIEPKWFTWYSYITGVTGVLGETGSTLYIPNAQKSNQGEYTFVVSNFAGDSPVSNIADLGVFMRPEIVLQPSPMTVVRGGTGMFHVGATGDSPIDYIWYGRIAGVTGVLGETTDTLYIPNAQETDEGIYAVKPYNGFGDGPVSNEVALTVSTDPIITQQPISQRVLYTQTATFSVVAVTDPSFSTLYQWNFNGSAMSGATGASVSIPNVHDANLGGYSVTITNGSGVLVSDTASLSIRTNAPDSPMSDIGVPGYDRNAPRGGRQQLRDTQMGNPHGDRVDNTSGTNTPGNKRSQGLNSNRGSYGGWASRAPNISP